MAEFRFCFACQRRNPAGAEVCEYCGAPLIFRFPNSQTTGIVVQQIPTLSEDDEKLDAYLTRLADNYLALFVGQNEEPILLPNYQSRILGRMQSQNDATLVDLSSYDALAYGVSRFHARLVFENGFFKVEDLSSTNGSFLNGERLLPGKLYVLHNKDKIILGQLNLSVCYHEGVLSKTVDFELKPSPGLTITPLQMFTPQFFKTTLSDYLEALVKLYQVCQQCQGLAIEVACIHAVRRVGPSAALHVQMDNVGETLALIQQWIKPWKQAHAEQPIPKTNPPDTLLQNELTQVSRNLLLAITPHLDPVVLDAYIERLSGTVLSLATSELELS